MIGSLQSCVATGFSSALGLAPNATPIVISQICFLWGTTLILYCLAEKVIAPKKIVLDKDPPIHTEVKKSLLISVTATLALSILFFSEGIRKGCQFS